MPDINIDLDFFDHRKTKRTVGLLGRGSDILPIRLWGYCGKYHSEDGKLIGYSEQEIESACDWWGEKGKMVEAFLAVGWLEKTDEGYQTHDWEEHQGHLKSYKKRAKEAAKARWSRIENATSNAPSIPQAMLSPPLSNATSRIVEKSSVPISPDEGCGEKEAIRKRVGAIFHRRETTVWSDSEEKAFRKFLKLEIPDDELRLVERFHESDCKYKRKDVEALLNNFNTEVSRAKDFFKNGNYRNGDDDSTLPKAYVAPGRTL